jgi:3-methyladenine DNA glycosylase AlkD
VHAVIGTLQAELKAVDKPANRMDYQRWFKEKLDNPVGLKTPVLRKVSNKVFRSHVRNLDRDETLGVCDEMLRGGGRYMRFFAFDWASRIAARYEKRDFTLFERWLRKYVDNWGNCDHLCGVLGMALVKFPELSGRRMKWASSPNLWLRRASAVALIEPVKRGLLLDDVFGTAERLMTDEEDLVQKGYGWMLKVTGDHFFDEAYAFVMKHREVMPRAALRYAIEKWPAARRREAMAKG